jgi:hypothetical protein
LTVIKPGKFEDTRMGENGTTYKLKATCHENMSNGKATEQFDFEAEDSKGGRRKGFTAGEKNR